MNNLHEVFRQVRYTNKTYWRNPAAVFFTFAFPLMFLVIFTTIFGGDDNTVHISPTLSVSTSTFYVPAIAVFSIISACYTNLAISIAASRDTGALKRLHGTPLSAKVYLLSRIIHSILISIILVAIVIIFGALFYHAQVPTTTLPAFLLTLVVGAGTFCALGLAVAAIIPNADAAPAMVNGIMLPLLFTSNVFIPLTNAPAWLNIFSKIFPVKHFSSSMLASYFPIAGQSAFRATDLLIMLAWGIGGLLIAIRYFSWEPRR
jgi:ABC-2 type transport system permease protein